MLLKSNLLNFKCPHIQSVHPPQCPSSLDDSNYQTTVCCNTCCSQQHTGLFESQLDHVTLIRTPPPTPHRHVPAPYTKPYVPFKPTLSHVFKQSTLRIPSTLQIPFYLGYLYSSFYINPFWHSTSAQMAPPLPVV